MEEKRYKEIFNKIKDFLPENWSKVALYFLFTDSTISNKFFIDSGNGYQDYTQFGLDFRTIYKSIVEMEDILISERAKLPPKKAWSVFTMFVDNTGKFDVNYDYGNMNNKFIKYGEKWVKTYIFGPKDKNKN